MRIWEPGASGAPSRGSPLGTEHAGWGASPGAARTQAWRPTRSCFLRANLRCGAGGLNQHPTPGGRQWRRRWEKAGEGRAPLRGFPNVLSVSLLSPQAWIWNLAHVDSAPKRNPGPGQPLTSSTVHRATLPACTSATPGSSLRCCLRPRGRSRKGWADEDDMKTDWCRACCVRAAKCSVRQAGG